jgi:hypothetical protein
MTAEALWAAAGLASLADPIDSSEPIFAISRSQEPVLIEPGAEAELPELCLA